MIAIGVISSIVLVLFPKYFFDAITEEKNFVQALFVLLAFLLYNIVISVIRNLLKTLIDVTNEDVKYNLKKSIIQRVYEIPYVQFEDPNCYDQIQRAIEFVESNKYQTLDTIAGIISEILSLSAIIYVLSQLNLWIILFLALAMTVDYVVNLFRDKKVFKTRNRLTRTERLMNYFFRIATKRENLKDLRLNKSQNFVSNKFETAYFRSRTERVKLRSNLLFLQLPTRITDALFTGGLYGFLGWELFTGIITMGSFSMLLSAAQNVKAMLITIQSGISRLRQSALAAQNFYEIFDKSTVSNTETKLPPTEWNNRGLTVRFNHVTFTYPGQTLPVINDVSFTISSSEKVVLVGENGAGKSTIIKLMIGLYQPDCGEVLINETNINDINRNILYDYLSVVFQDHAEFCFTIAENILMDKVTPEKHELVWQALDSVGLSTRIKNCPLEEHTLLTRELSDDGVDLSGGERQKVAIARAYVKQAGLLVMDEPSSSLDVYSESDLFSHLLQLSNNQTAVIVTHRVLALKEFDRILYVDEGRIVEDGTHDELMDRRGAYFDMYNKQNFIYKIADRQ